MPVPQARSKAGNEANVIDGDEPASLFCGRDLTAVAQSAMQ